MKIVILGGGPSGLALVDELTTSSDIPFILFEQDSDLGGLAKTVQWEGHGAHDLGPHKIFTLDEKLLARVKNLIPAHDWLTQEKKSSIFMNGHYLPYPPSPFSLIGVYGPLTFSKMVFDFGMAKIKSLFNRSEPKTFEADLEKRMGAGLYNTLFKPIALKLWGNPTDLDVKLSKSRVQTPSIVEVISRLLKIKKTSDFEALEFIYPQAGLQRLWNSIYDKTSGQGDFKLNTSVTRIAVSDNKITDVFYKVNGGDEEQRLTIAAEDMVFSTIPLGTTTKIMGNAIPEETKLKVRDVVMLNDLSLVFLKINKKRLFSDSWIFIPDPKIPFHRICEQASFDPGMTPNGSIICCEIMGNKARPMHLKSDKELISLSKQGLVDMGFSDYEILDSRVIRLPKSYPVFRPNFEPALKEILKEFDKISNFKTIGRQGSFNYIGTLDAMDIGYGAAEWAIRKVHQKQAASWEEERLRTSFYPVLD